MQQRTRTPNKTTRHTFRLTEAQNAELLARADRAGCRENLSKFIVSQLLRSGEKPQPTPQINTEYLKKLCNMYFQFQKIGNNYNQVVRAVHTHSNDETVIKLLRLLIGYTRQLKAQSERIIALTEELKKEWLR